MSDLDYKQHPLTDEYSEGWDRVFRRKVRKRVATDEGIPSLCDSPYLDMDEEYRHL